MLHALVAEELTRIELFLGSMDPRCWYELQNQHLVALIVSFWDKRISSFVLSESLAACLLKPGPLCACATVITVICRPQV